MRVKLITLTGTRLRYRRPGKTATTDRAYVRAEVDGHIVSGRARDGWDCACPDPDCGHVDALAALIHPNLLAELDK